MFARLRFRSALLPHPGYHSPAHSIIRFPVLGGRALIGRSGRLSIPLPSYVGDALLLGVLDLGRGSTKGGVHLFSLTPCWVYVFLVFLGPTAHPFDGRSLFLFRSWCRPCESTGRWACPCTVVCYGHRASLRQEWARGCFAFLCCQHCSTRRAYRLGFNSRHTYPVCWGHPSLGPLIAGDDYSILSGITIFKDHSSRVCLSRVASAL